MVEQKAGMRSTSRCFFHEGRYPPVLLQMSGWAYAGALLDRSLVGVGIRIASAAPDIEIGQIAENLYIGKPDEDCRLRGFVVAYIRADEVRGETYVGLYSNDEEEQKKLLKLVPSEVHHPDDKNGATKFRADRLPISQGADHYSSKAVQERCEWLERACGSRIVHLADNHLEPLSLAGNIENYVGAVQIPVGIAGPLLINGLYAKGHIPVPMATTEGALIASVSRGARICTLSGGIQTHVLHQVMSRAPIFFCGSLDASINLEKWILSNIEPIAARAESVSSIAKLINLKTFVFGNCVHLHFFYSTGDAAGQNMTTACTFMACQWIADMISKDKSIDFREYLIEGNHSGDKKANIGNYVNGRGIAVYAESHISHSHLQRYLRTTARRLVRLQTHGEIAAMRLGMLGCNVNYANAVAAIFAATGQDIASVHESAMGIIKFEETETGLKVSTYLPSLVVGTVGGGTGLPTQKEALQLMHCYGAGNSFRLAEIIGATCLALDLSTAGAIDSNEFVQAHERLGRNRPSKYLAKSELTCDFFQKILFTKELSVKTVEPLELNSKHGLTSGMLSSRRSGITGIFRYKLELRNEVTERDWSEAVVLKLKSSSAEILGLGVAVARLSGDETLPGLMEANHEVMGFLHCDLREIEILKLLRPKLGQFLPRILGSQVDEGRSIYAILMEDLSNCTHLNSVDTPEKWKKAQIKSVLAALAQIHSKYLNRPELIPDSAMVLNSLDEKLQNASSFIERLHAVAAERNAKWVSPTMKKELLEFTLNLKQHVKTMRKSYQTLTHNDCNPRNICLREDGTPVFYDWELCAYQNPHSDLAEFLIFVLHGDKSEKHFFELVHFYIECLQRDAKISLDETDFFCTLRLNIFKLCLVRFNLYSLVAPMMDFHFLERIWKNSSTFAESLTSYR